MSFSLGGRAFRSCSSSLCWDRRWLVRDVPTWFGLFVEGWIVRLLDSFGVC